ncbi:hypothetical protein BJY52DRAFT_1121414 [Lactarius psammicola]|nr:hypothetical protein BJY52DRAFT_1121414 [Lactarius psammicola]
MHLSTIVDTFPGAANQTHCFAHTINISAKSILKQFNIPKTRPGVTLNLAAQALTDLANELGSEERTKLHAWEPDDSAEEDDQPLDTWVDLHKGLTEEEVSELDKSIQPVRSMLTKLRRLAFALKNSMTILLPQWFATLLTHCLPKCMMPHDVSTCWNSTYDMLNFSLKYRLAIDTITASCNYNLHKYELLPAEWKIAQELCDVLKVNSYFFICYL